MPRPSCHPLAAVLATNIASAPRRKSLASIDAENWTALREFWQGNTTRQAKSESHLTSATAALESQPEMLPVMSPPHA